MTIYGKGCISNYRNCSLSYVWYSVLYRMLTVMLQVQDIYLAPATLYALCLYILGVF